MELINGRRTFRGSYENVGAGGRISKRSGSDTPPTTWKYEHYGSRMNLYLK